MIYNNGTVSVHKSYIDSLLFAAIRSGLNSGKGRGRGSRYLKEGGSYETVW